MVNKEIIRAEGFCNWVSDNAGAIGASFATFMWTNLLVEVLLSCATPIGLESPWLAGWFMNYMALSFIISMGLFLIAFITHNASFRMKMQKIEDEYQAGIKKIRSKEDALE